MHGDSEGSQDEVGWTLPLSQVGLALALDQDAKFFWGLTHRASTKALLTCATLVVTCLTVKALGWFPSKERSLHPLTAALIFGKVGL